MRNHHYFNNNCIRWITLLFTKKDLGCNNFTTANVFSETLTINGTAAPFTPDIHLQFDI